MVPKPIQLRHLFPPSGRISSDQATQPAMAKPSTTALAKSKQLVADKLAPTFGKDGDFTVVVEEAPESDGGALAWWELAVGAGSEAVCQMW